MIKFVTGTLGHGKTMYGARIMGQTLLGGRCVLSNIILGVKRNGHFYPCPVDDHGYCVPVPNNWQHYILSHSPWYKAATKKAKVQMIREVSTRYRFEEDFERMVDARLKGFGEGRGRRLFDEAHAKLNNRSWKEIDQNLVLRQLTLGRHRGWDDYIISQHAKNTDVALRRIADSEVRVVDWQKLIHVPVIHARLLPFHLFLAQTFPIEESAVPGVQRLGRRTSSELFHLGWWANIYDTFADVRFGDEEDTDPNRIWLPAAPQPIRVIAGGNPSKANAAGVSDDSKTIDAGSQP